MGFDVRQGDSPSRLLFVFSIQALLMSVHFDIAVLGLHFPGSATYVASRNADDATLFLLDAASLQRVLDIFVDYSQLSGAPLNLTTSHFRRSGYCGPISGAPE